MTDLKTHYSCAELAEMKLPGLPSSERGLRDRVKKEGWMSRQVEGGGGKDGVRTEYQPPSAIMDRIKEKAFKETLKNLPVPVAAPMLPASPEPARLPVASSTADAAQLMIRDARLGIVNVIMRASEMRGITVSGYQ